MPATFEIKINAVRTATVNELANVVKQVDWSLVGKQEGQTFELPQSTVLSDPEASAFGPFDQITQAIVTEWVAQNADNMPAIEAHIQYVLDKECAKAGLTDAPLPWAPEPTPAPAAETV